MHLVQHLELAPFVLLVLLRLLTGLRDVLLDKVLVRSQPEIVVLHRLRFHRYTTKRIFQVCCVQDFEILTVVLDVHIVFANLACSLQMLEEFGIKLSVAIEERDFCLYRMLFFNGFGSSTLTDNGIKRFLLFLLDNLVDMVFLQEVFVFLQDGLRDNDLLCVDIIDLHHTTSITERIINFVFLSPEFLQDVQVIANVFVLRVRYQIVDIRSASLTVAVNTTVALFQCDERPGEIIIEHPVTVVVQVHALGASIATDEQSNLAVPFSEVLNHGLLLYIAK